MGEVRQFKGIWIPAHIWLNKNLSAIDKVLLADIDSFTGNGKMFYKSNATIAQELHVSESTVKRSIKALSEHKLIQTFGGTRKRQITSLLADSGQYEQHSGQKEQDSAQNDPALGSNRPTINTKSSTGSNSLQYPFECDEFREAWNVWRDERKQRKIRKYTLRGEQAALHKLQQESNGCARTAVAMIHNAIARGWQGIYPIKNDATSKERFDSSEYSDYLETFSK